MKTVAAIAVMLWTLLWPALANATSGTPAGYVVSIALAGEDATSKTAVVRGGAELPVKLMMPVLSGDTVFLRDAASRIRLEMGDGEVVEVGGGLPRFEVKGEIDTGDDAWSVIAAIGDVLGGGDGTPVAPDNMVSRSDEGALAMPLARRGTNYILTDQDGLWLGWTGGVAPFQISIDGNMAMSAVQDRQAAVMLAGGQAERIDVLVQDARGHRVQLRLKRAAALPDLPKGIEAKPPGITGRLALAGWLTGAGEGAWRLAAAQVLSEVSDREPAAAALLDAMRQGWTAP